jgi:hypothetical protein
MHTALKPNGALIELDHGKGTPDMSDKEFTSY